VRVERVQWEPILKTDRGGILGASDLHAVINLPTPTLAIDVVRIEQDELGLVWELPQWRDQPHGSLLGNGEAVWFRGSDARLRVSDDVLRLMKGVVATSGGSWRVTQCNWSHDRDYAEVKLLIEAKTEIRAAGELIRQLNLYRSAVSGETKVIVVAPASQWKPGLEDILREQGFYTLTYLANG
jgi:hypothetical protein